MATSGTALFNINFLEIAEEAFERCGREMRTGYDLRTARRSLNLLTLEWGNKGINFWTMEDKSVTLVKGQASYDIDRDTIDVLEAVVRDNANDPSKQTDFSLTRKSMADYTTISSKLLEGRPSQYVVERLRDGTRLTLWPVPAADGQKLIYWRLRRIQDMTAGTEYADVPFRFLPALTAGLAYYIGLKTKDADKVALEAEYVKQWQLAKSADRDRSSFFAIPSVRRA